jgi:transcriptional antiterminator NusG
MFVTGDVKSDSAGKFEVTEQPHNSSQTHDESLTEGAPVDAPRAEEAAAALPPDDTAPEAVRQAEPSEDVAAAAVDAEPATDEAEDDGPIVEEEVEPRGPIEETPVGNEEPELRWYILKVQSNREDSIRESLQRRVKVAGLDRYFGEIIVPTEMVSEFKGGKKRVVKRKLYPGYIVVHMQITDDSWFLVRETPGIGDFTGAAGKPTPMLAHEIAKIIELDKPEEEQPEKLNIRFKVGDRVKINDGTFESFEGDVDAIDEASGRVTVMINIFGRSTPVELEYWQIETL